MSRQLALNLVLDAETGKLIGSLDKGEKAVKDFGTRVEKTDKKTKQAGQTVGSFGKAFKLLGGVVAGVSLAYFVTQLYEGIDAMQGMEAQLKTVTGSVGDAALEMDRLTNFAKKTPFTINQSVEAFTKLVNLGLTPSEKAMLSYGNTAAAMGKDMMQMVEAVADAAVGEFERLKEFGIKAKKNGDEVAFTFQGQTKTVKNNAKSIEEYLQAIGENEFSGAMTDQMDRLSAKTSNLGISLQVLAKTVGDSGLTAVFGYGIDTAAGLTDGFNDLLESGQALDELTIWAEQFGEVFGLVLEDLALTETVEDISEFGDMYMTQWGKVFTWFGEKFDGFIDILKDFPAHYRTIYAIIIGEVQIIFEEVRHGSMLFFSFMDEGFESMSHSVSIAWKWIELQFGKMSDGILGTMSDMLETIGESIDGLPGMSGMTESVKEAALALDGMASSEARVKASIEAENKAHKEKLKIIEKVRQLSAKDSSETISGINARTLRIIKERNEIIKTANKKRVAAAEARTNAKKEKAEQQEILKAKREASNAVEVYDDQSIKELIGDVDDLGEAWKNTGNIMVDAFGSIANQIDKMGSSFEAYSEKQKVFDERREKINSIPDLQLRDKALNELNTKESRMQQQHLQDTVGGFASITGAASEMFDEQSKGREVLHKMEQAFTVIEVALALKKAGANAMAAIAGQGQGDPYTAFARIAAMAALMAGLGLFSGSVSGSPVDVEARQKEQGTGTVFGSDEKSASISNATERMFDLELDQYAVLREMNNSLRDLNQNITYLATSFVSNFGKFNGENYNGQLGTSGKISGDAGAIGGIGRAVDKSAFNIVGKIFSSFKSTKKSLVDSGISIVSQTLGDIIDTGLVQAQQYFDIKTKKKSFWGMKKKTSYNTETQDVNEQLEHELALIFSSLGNSLDQAVKVLGVDTARSLEDFVISMPNISFKDLSGDEIQAELEAMFSQQADLMATFLMPGIAEFQKVGEGLYDTLIRVAQEQAIFNNNMQAAGLELARFGDLSKEAEIAITQSLVGLMGGIENYLEQTNLYFSEFFTEQEQFTHLSNQVNDQFAALNQELPLSRDGFRDLVEGVDLTTESGQALFAVLMALVPQMDEYYDQLEQQQQAINNMNGDLESQLARFDMSGLEVALDDIEQWKQAAIEAAQELGVTDFTMIELLAKKKIEAVMEQHAKAVSDMNDNLANQLARFDMTDIQAAISDIEAWKRKAIEAAEELGETDFTLIEKIAERKLADVLKAEIDSIENKFSELSDAIKATSSNIASAILDIKKGMSGFDAVGHYSSKVSGLKGGLGQGTVSEQLTRIDSITVAINERYQAELAAIDSNNEMEQAAHQNRMAAYQEQISAIQTMNDAAKALKKASKDLLVGGLSPLTAGQQYSEIEQQFKLLLSKAKSGDSEAMGSLQEKGEQYLGFAQKYNPADYAAIFGEVNGAFSTVGDMQKELPPAPSPHSITLDYQTATEQLAADTLAELLALQELTDELNTQASEDMEISLKQLQEQFTKDTEKLEEPLKEILEIIPDQTKGIVEAIEDQASIMAAQTNSISEMAIGVVEAIRSMPAPVVNVTVDAQGNVDYSSIKDELQKISDNILDSRNGQALRRSM